MARRLGTAYVGIEADASLFRATAMAGMKKAMAGLEGKIPVTADLKKARANIAGFLAELQMLHPEIEMGLDTNQAKRVIQDFRGRVGLLASELDAMRANPDVSHAALGQITRLQLAVRNAAADLNKMKPNVRNLQDFESRIVGIENSWDRVTASIAKVATAEEEAAKRVNFFRGLAPQISDLVNRTRMLGDSLDENVVAGARRAHAALESLLSRKFEISPAGFAQTESALASIVASVTGLETRLKEAADAESVLNAKTEESTRLFALLLPRVNELTDRLRHMRMGFESKDAQVAIDGILARLARIRQADVTPENFMKLVSDIGRAELAADKVVTSMEKIGAAERDAAAQAAFFAQKITPGLNEISKRLLGMKAGMDDKVFLSKIADMDAAVARFRTRKISFDDASMKAAEAELARLLTRTDALSAGVENMNDRLTKGRVSWFGWIGGLLQARVQLYAGYRQVTGWHIALDSIVEVLAILVPALVIAAAGLGAFGAAAYLAQDTLKRIGQHMKYVQTVSDATGKVIPPLTNHFNRLAGSVRPDVFQLLGAAVGGAGSQMKIFDKLALGTGALLDRWAAQILVDMRTGQGGINKFIGTGTFMLQKLGVVAQNVGHVISQLVEVATRTHIAEGIITAVAAFSQLLSVVADLPVPLLAAVALTHGLYLWFGLFTSLAVKTILGPVRGMANLAAGAKLAGVAVKSLPDDAKGLQRITAYVKDIGKGFSAIPARAKDLLGVLKVLGASPWTWVAVGVAALIGLGIWLSRTKTAANLFAQSMDEMTAHATIFNVINTLGSELIQTNDKLAVAQRKLNDELKKGTSNTAAFNARFGPLGTGVQAAASAVTDYTTVQKRAFGEMLVGTQRLSGLAERFGQKGLAGAMALAALAGVKVNTLIKGSAKDWAVAEQQVQDLVNGYKAMGQGANQLGADLNALTVAGSDQVKQINNLNSAFDTFTKSVAGPVSGFLSFTQTIQRFGEDAQKAGAHMTGLGGGLEASSKKVRSSSVQLQLDFQDTFNSAEQLFNAMRSSEAPAAVQVAAIKHAVQALIPMAGTNKAAAAEVSALAQEAGGPATTNLQQLAKWAGKTHDPLKALNDDANQATVGFSNLSLDAQRLGTTLQQDLSKDMADAIKNAIGLQGAMEAFAKDLRAGTEETQKGQRDRKALADVLDIVTGSAKGTNAVIQAMTDRLHANAQAITDTSKARGNYNNDLQKILQLAPTSATDIQKLTDQIRNHGTTSDRYKSIRQHLIDDLKRSGTSAKDAARLVDGLATSVKQLPPGKTMKITMTANGQVNITEGKEKFSISQGAWRSPHAQGGFISGGQAGRDSVPAMLMPGEVVVPTSMVSAGAVDHLRGALPGFSAGGVVKGYAHGGMIGSAGSLKGTPDGWPSQMYGAIQSQAQAQTNLALTLGLTQAVKAGMKLAMAGSGPAVLRYAESFKGKVPYVWGGATPSGWDCSGFVSYVYNHFKLLFGRLDAQSLQSWAKPSSPVPGGMAFYGTPAHHVGFVVDGHTLLSALHHGTNTVETSLNMGDNSGYGVPPQGFGKAGAGAGGGPSGSSLQELAFSMLQSRGWGVQWPAFNSLEVREAGWRMNARNPSSGAYGLAQFINGPSDYYKYGGNPNTGQGQLTAMMNYIAQRYGDPNAAWAHEIGAGWYAKGGMVRKMAAGGLVPAEKWVPQLSKSQHGEAYDYAGLTGAYKHDLAHAVKGSWTAGHRAGITSELKTLAKRQAAEVAAYRAIINTGTAKTNLTHMGSAARGVNTVSKDIDLSHSHKGWTHGLQGWLASLIRLSGQGVQVARGSQNKLLPWKVWLATLKALEGKEAADYKGLFAAFYVSLLHAKKGSWLYKNKTGVRERLYAVAIKHNAERKAYNDLLAHTTGTVPNLNALPARMGAVKNAARAEYNAMQPSLLAHLPGGHPGWVKALQGALRGIYSIHGTTGPAWTPGNLGPSHTATRGVLQFAKGGKVFDTGGWLDQGPNLVFNNTGSREHVTPDSGGGGDIHIHLTNQGVIGSQQQLDAWLTASVSRLSRTGYLSKAVRT